MKKLGGRAAFGYPRPGRVCALGVRRGAGLRARPAQRFEKGIAYRTVAPAGAFYGYRTLLKPIKITVLLNAHSDKADELRALLDGLVEPSRAEPGNLRFDIWQDQANPNRFVLDELYTDNAAVTAHRASPHVQDYLSKINELADRNSMTLNPVVVR